MIFLDCFLKFSLLKTDLHGGKCCLASWEWGRSQSSQLFGIAGEEGFLMRELCYLSLTLTMQSFVLTHTTSFKVFHIIFYDDSGSFNVKGK